MRKGFALLCALCLLLGLAACGGRGLTALDAAEHVQGLLDVTYLGVYDEGYLKSVGITQEQAQADHESGLEVEYEYFTYCFDMNTDYLTGQTHDAIVALLADIYQHSDYEVGTVTKQEDRFTIEVSIAPIDIIPLVVERDMEAYSAAFADAYAHTDQAAVAAMSAVEQDAFWTAYENDWAMGVVELFRARLDELGHLEQVSVTVQFGPDEEGVYTISDKDFSAIDARILAYSY